MDINNAEWFYSLVFKDQKSVSEYQIKLDAKSDKKEELISEFSDILDGEFLGKLFSTKDYKIPYFLEFHYQHYEGNKTDFINHVRYIVTPALAAMKGSKSYFTEEITIAHSEALGNIIF